MIENIVNTAMLLLIIYTGYRMMYNIIFYSVEYNELEKSYQECPKCESFLYVEYGKYANVYRCKECRFEGIREPLVYGIAQTFVRAKKQAKAYYSRTADK